MAKVLQVKYGIGYPDARGEAVGFEFGPVSLAECLDQEPCKSNAYIYQLPEGKRIYKWIGEKWMPLSKQGRTPTATPKVDDTDRIVPPQRARKPEATSSDETFGKADLGLLMSRLDFSEEEIVQASLVQPRIMLEASKYRVQCMRDAQRKKAEYDELRARIGLAIRAKGSNPAGGKITEGYIDQEIDVTEEVINARRAKDESIARDEFSTLLLDVAKARAQTIKILTDVMSMELAAEGKSALHTMAMRSYDQMKDEVRQRFRRKE